MKAINLIPLLLFFSQLTTVLCGQSVITGSVTTSKGEPLPGANIYLENTYEGTSSNTDGSFSFSTSESGSQTLLISMLGFHEYRKEIICDGSTISVSVILKDKIDQLNAVTITAGAMEASDSKKAVVLKAFDVVTTPGAIGNLVGAMNKLPGTATVGNDGRLFVRGGDASETNIYFDGLQTGNAYGTTAQNLPTRARFNPNLFKGSFFSTGGYSAEYGQALSSALVLNSIDMPLRNQADISLMSIGAGYTQTLVGENSAFTGSLNYTDLKPYQSVIPQNFDWNRAPQSWNAELLGRQKYGRTGLLKAFFHTEGSYLSLNQEVPGTEDKRTVEIQNNYYFGNSSFKQNLNETWNIYGGLSYSHNIDNLKIDNTELSRISSLGHAKLAATKYFSDRFTLKNGLEYYLNEFQEDIKSVGASRKLRDNTVNHFAEADFYLSSKLVLRGGLRTTFNDYVHKVWTSPRVSVAYKAGEHSQVSLAAGNFRQLATNEIRIQQEELENSQSNHLILNYTYSKKGRLFRAEGFYKSYDALIQYDSLRNQNYHGLSTNGNGYARGFDMFYRDSKTIRTLDFWVTYSFINSERSYNQFETMVTPSFAPMHNASVVAKKWMAKLKSQVGMSYSWNNGYTYHNPNLPGEMQGKTKWYNNLSLNWSYLPKPNVIIHLECSNVAGFDNEFGYNYSETPTASGHYAESSIGQPADRFLFVGVFITLSEDKSANNLNNL